MGMAHLFDPISFRSITLANRIIVSPMCEYSCVDGFSNDWHLVHLGSRAVGGAALVMTEATAVTADGRISPEDLGLYDDGHVAGLAHCVRFIHSQHALAGTQLAHAGRKGSTYRPWGAGTGAIASADGGWQAVGPSGKRRLRRTIQPRVRYRSRRFAEWLTRFAPPLYARRRPASTSSRFTVRTVISSISSCRR